MIYAVKKLKGGSLSSTYYIKAYDQEYISKEIVRDQNREYGFVRWYSQLKKLQRYNTLYPNLFPKVIDTGVDHNKAYFKIEYMKGFRDIKTILTNDTLTNEQIFRISQAVWKGLNQLHSVTHDAILGAGNLYFEEEVLQKITDAIAVPEFADFYAHGTYEYDGRIVQGITASGTCLRIDIKPFIVWSNLSLRLTTPISAFSADVTMNNILSFIDAILYSEIV